MAINKNTDPNWAKSKDTLVAAAEKVDVDPGIMAKIAGFESNYSSTNRPISSDPKLNTVTQFDGTKAVSSAYGYGQFLNGTWATMVREHGAKYGVANAESLTDKQANAAELRNDPKLQAAMLAELTKHNVDLGRKLGGGDDDANVYALHNLGEGDGRRFLKALKSDPDQSVANLFPASRGDKDKDGISDIIEGNPSLYLKAGKPVTVAEAYARMGKHMDQYEKYAIDARKDQPQRTEDQAPATQGGDAKKPTTQTQGTDGTWPAPGNYSINKADKPGEGRGDWNTRRPAHRDGDGHDGVDIQGKVGDPIKAFKAGTVVTAGNVRGYGNTIDIRHEDGSVTRYAHLDSIDAKVKPGHPVGEGQQIGKMGQTGNSPKAGDAHLHFEVRVKGKDVDPMPFLAKADRDGRTQADPKTATPVQSEKSGAMKDGVLKVGDRGPEVKEYLEKLDKLGYRGPKGESLLADKPDIYGPAAKFATEKFQQAHGISVDGKAGKDTLPAVDKALGNPLLSEANHPGNGYYRNVAAQIEKFSPGTDPRVAMNVAKEGIQEGYKEPQVGYSKERGLFAIGPVPGAGVTPGTRVLVEAGVPAESAQSLSDRAAADFKSMEAGKPATTPVVIDADLEERHRAVKPMSFA